MEGIQRENNYGKEEEEKEEEEEIENINKQRNQE